MKTIVSIMISIAFTTLAIAAETGYSLNTSKGRDTFANCAVSVALGETQTFTLNKLLHSEVLDGSAPAKLSYLYFTVTTKTGSELILRLTFRTHDSEGWIALKDDNGETYPFAATVDPKALLVDTKSGSVLGARDISSCFNESLN